MKKIAEKNTKHLFELYYHEGEDVKTCADKSKMSERTAKEKIAQSKKGAYNHILDEIASEMKSSGDPAYEEERKFALYRKKTGVAIDDFLFLIPLHIAFHSLGIPISEAEEYCSLLKHLRDLGGDEVKPWLDAGVELMKIELMCEMPADELIPFCGEQIGKAEEAVKLRKGEENKLRDLRNRVKNAQTALESALEKLGSYENVMEGWKSIGLDPAKSDDARRIGEALSFIRKMVSLEIDEKALEVIADTMEKNGASPGEASVRIAEIIQQYESVDQAIAGASKKLSETRAEIRRLKRERDGLNGQLTDLKDEHARMHPEVLDLRSEKGALTRSVDGLAKIYGSMSSDIDHARAFRKILFEGVMTPGLRSLIIEISTNATFERMLEAEVMSTYPEPKEALYNFACSDASTLQDELFGLLIDICSDPEALGRIIKMKFVRKSEYDGVMKQLNSQIQALYKAQGELVRLRSENEKFKPLEREVSDLCRENKGLQETANSLKEDLKKTKEALSWANSGLFLTHMDLDSKAQDAMRYKEVYHALTRELGSLDGEQLDRLIGMCNQAKTVKTIVQSFGQIVGLVIGGKARS